MSPIGQKLETNLLLIFRMKGFRHGLRNFSTSNSYKSSKLGPRTVTLDNMNKNVIQMEYAVRGPIVTRAQELEKELVKGNSLPFKTVIKANLGDCHAMKQQPVTYYRQVLALILFPELFSDSRFPPDTVRKAKELLSVCRGGSVGSYSDSLGIEAIRQHCAESIAKRDNYPAKMENILLSSGASEGIKNVLKLINQEVGGKPPGVMIPIPQYPLYSATIVEYGMCLMGYYLEERNNWSLDLKELDRSLNEGKKKCNPRAIVVINPGNPTGQVLTKQNVEDIIKFAYNNKLLILADEVYQMNVYAKGSEFHSFKKVINDLGEPYSQMELASFMSCSKGYMGECGIRGAFCELLNIDPEVRANYNKLISAMLCPSTVGQCLMDCVAKPPEPGDPSYDLFEEEKNGILKDLKEKAGMVYEFFNKIDGFSCNEPQGAMYAFPKLEIPPKALEEAKKRKIPGDTLYAYELLENTGICIIPGSGFRQEPGTYHFRTTILPKRGTLIEMLKLFESFHKVFLKKYS